MYSEQCEDVRDSVRQAIIESLTTGSYKDWVSVEEVHRAVFKKMEIDIEEKYSYGPVMTVIKEEILSLFNRKIGASRKTGKYIRLYRCLKLKENNNV